ncbi:putative lipase [Variovorax sp. SRS16]|uniref:lipase family protein n=1 Tax=Variovorax sp. SRS16 TaxID=282217 RepID=UPI001315ECC3|nr:lipase family protein [Variovorax sp. SRS16]VTU15141.1 putative lipase [Variovorax sp. SRS16]
MATIPYDASRAALYAPEHRDTLFAAGERYTPTQRAVEAARLAYYRAETSTTEHARLIDALARAGFDAPTLFVEGATFAFGALHAHDGGALVAFRGTQPDEIRHLATNLQAQQTAWAPTGGRVHAGFAHAARAVLPRIQDWLAGAASRRSSLVLAGHSLGAALATLAATVTPPTLLVTLGSPRVGDADFVAVLAGAEIVRLVDGCDVVTQVPPALSFYAHAGAPTYITCDQAICVIDPTPSFIETDRAQGRARYATEHAWKPGAVLLRDLADHAPVNYARAYFG